MVLWRHLHFAMYYADVPVPYPTLPFGGKEAKNFVLMWPRVSFLDRALSMQIFGAALSHIFSCCVSYM